MWEKIKKYFFRIVIILFTIFFLIICFKFGGFLSSIQNLSYERKIKERDLATKAFIKLNADKNLTYEEAQAYIKTIEKE